MLKCTIISGKHFGHTSDSCKMVDMVINRVKKPRTKQEIQRLMSVIVNCMDGFNIAEGCSRYFPNLVNLLFKKSPVRHVELIEVCKNKIK